jgi:membrane-associated HD superfamily phosphohydrolase
MDLLNMFSDLAPISNNGYRQQLNTDPGILQGVEFLQNENKVKREVAENLDLNLISDSHGMESATVHSAGLLNDEDTLVNIEGFKENMDGPTTKYYNDLRDQYKTALYKFNALVSSSKVSLAISGPIVTGIATQYNSVGRGASSSGIYYSSWCSQTTNNICNAEYRVIFSNGVISDMTIQSMSPSGLTNPSLLFAVTNIPSSDVTATLQGKNIASSSNDNKWYDVDIPTQKLTPSQTSILFSGNTGVFKSTSSAGNVPDAVKTTNQELKKKLDALSAEMANISSLMMSNVKDNTTNDFTSYNKMQKDIDNVQKRIIQVDGIMKKNSTKQIYDIDTSLAKEEETALLSKQRYYVYVIWFVILVIILYITISNLVNPDSSFSVLLVTLILLILLFLFFMYNKWNAEWYDLKLNLKNLSFSLPDIPKINFNPLVSIKYTS